MSRLFLAAIGLCLMASVSPDLAQGRRGGGGDEGQRRPGPPPWTGKSDVSGKVLDEAGKGIKDAKVTWFNPSVNAGLFVATNKNGEFQAKGIKSGEWRVQVEMANFVTFRNTVQVADSKNPPIEVKLKRDLSPELIAKAEELFKTGKFADARAEYVKVLADHPEMTGINRAIAFTYGREGNHPEALKYLDLALVNNPNDTMLLQLAAASATQVNDFPRVMGYLDRIDVASQTDPSILADAAVNLINKQRSAEAIKVLDRVIERFPQAADPYFYRGFAKLQAQKTADAKVDLEKYVSLAPPDAPQLAQAKELLAKIK